MHSVADAAERWRRSSYCSDAACLEIADVGDAVMVRDSKDRALPGLRFHRIGWGQFIDGVKQGHFDPS